jgi:hypothetical protein
MKCMDAAGRRRRLPHPASAEQSPTTRGGARRPNPGGGRLTPKTCCRGGHPGGPAEPPGPAGGQDEHLRYPLGRNAGPRGRGATENGKARSSSGQVDKAEGRSPSGIGGEAQRMNEMEEAPQYPNYKNCGAPCARVATTPRDLPRFLLQIPPYLLPFLPSPQFRSHTSFTFLLIPSS